jgi:hypothetical protein
MYSKLRTPHPPCSLSRHIVAQRTKWYLPLEDSEPVTLEPKGIVLRGDSYHVYAKTRIHVRKKHTQVIHLSQ